MCIMALWHPGPIYAVHSQCHFFISLSLPMWRFFIVGFLSSCFRRFYHIVDFVMFFFNVLIGLFTCMKRIFFSVLFGSMLLSRLDRPLLMQGFVRFDTGIVTQKYQYLFYFTIQLKLPIFAFMTRSHS